MLHQAPGRGVGAFTESWAVEPRTGMGMSMQTCECSSGGDQSRADAFALISFLLCGRQTMPGARCLWSSPPPSRTAAWPPSSDCPLKSSSCVRCPSALRWTFTLRRVRTPPNTQ